MGPGVERNSLEITTLGRELGWTTLSDSIQRQLQSDIYIFSQLFPQGFAYRRTL